MFSYIEIVNSSGKETCFNVSVSEQTSFGMLDMKYSFIISCDMVSCTDITLSIISIP